MSVSSRSTYQPRKHSKTFTGCWTCRARKVKCDEARPACRQCCQKSLQCEGYGVRLHWMPPETGDGGSLPESPNQLPRAKSQRSQIAFEPHQPLLHYYQLDEILGTIDTLEPKRKRELSHTAASPAAADSSLFIHHFGVFDAGQTPPNCDVPSQRLTQDETTHSCTSSDVDTPKTHPHHATFPVCTGDDTAFTVPAFLDDFNPQNLLGFDDLLTLDLSNVFPGPEQISTALAEPSNLIQGSSSQEASRSQALPTILSTERWHSPSEIIIRGPSPAYLSSQEQFLMYHYTHRVSSLFCVIDNNKSPWKTIHLPRALQSVGELNVGGTSSRIRGALRNALLSISAFCLSNDNKTQSRKDEAVKWANEATWFRGKAIKLLKEAVETDFYCEPKPKYKEFLATMLSMITINVMSGDTATCGLHLDGAFRLMNHAKTWKLRYSSKAQSLHRIYFYLRTIYESTAISSQGDDTSRLTQSSKAWVTGPAGSPDSDDSMSPTDTNCITTTNSRPPDAATRMATYEFIYGVPQSLLVLLNQSIDLINQVNDYREREGNTLVPAHLVASCDKLEKSIMDWSTETELKRCLPTPMSASSNIIYHTTRAFHNAVIIYFAQHIPLLGYRFLQHYVQIVLDSIEAIERIKAETQILAAPLYWPAFIAASEAFDDQLQERFRNWYDHVEVYGIEAVRTGIQVLTEVWKDGPDAGSRRTSSWRKVVERTGSTLMLS